MELFSININQRKFIRRRENIHLTFLQQRQSENRAHLKPSMIDIESEEEVKPTSAIRYEEHEKLLQGLITKIIARIRYLSGLVRSD